MYHLTFFFSLLLPYTPSFLLSHLVLLLHSLHSKVPEAIPHQGVVCGVVGEVEVAGEEKKKKAHLARLVVPGLRALVNPPCPENHNQAPPNQCQE